jgi:hypothetical protein
MTMHELDVEKRPVPLAWATATDDVGPEAAVAHSPALDETE